MAQKLADAHFALKGALTNVDDNSDWLYNPIPPSIRHDTPPSSVTCEGCLFNWPHGHPSQRRHMDIGGCLTHDV
jgi:hypothetical protein